VADDRERTSAKRDTLLAILAVMATIASGTFAWRVLTATDAPVAAPELPAPSTVASPVNLSPTVTRPILPPITLGPLEAIEPTIDGVERSVRGNLAPWENQAVDVVTGEPLATADFSADMTLITAVTDAVPPPWSLGPFDSTTVPTPAGDVAVDWAESTQPFRARKLIGPDGAPVARILIFAGTSEAGLSYVRQARVRWNPDAVADHLTLADTVMVTAVVPPAAETGGGIWFASLSRRVAVLIEATSTFTQQDLVGFLIRWRSSLIDG